MPRQPVEDDSDESDISLDDEQIKNLTLPEPEPIQIKINALLSMSRDISISTDSFRSLCCRSDRTKPILPARCGLARKKAIRTHQLHLQ